MSVFSQYLKKMTEPAPLTFTLTFLNEYLYEKSYIRNNKSNGRKNLRCFPHCQVDGASNVCRHSESGWCGAPVRAVIEWGNFSVREISPSLLMGDLAVTGRFEVLGAKPNYNSANFIEGTVTRPNPKENYALIAFNEARKPWSYDWIGGRFNDQSHAFVINISCGNSALQRFMSCPFKIVCARRFESAEISHPPIYEGIRGIYYVRTSTLILPSY